MKKVLFAAILAAFATASVAQTKSVGVEVTHRDGQNVMSVTPGVTFGKFTYDVKADFVRDQRSAQETAVEGRVRYDQPLTTTLTGFVRGGIGDRYTLGRNTGFYSVEPGVKLRIDKAASINASYRFENSFADTRGLKINTYQVGLDIEPTKVDTVGLKFFRETGDRVGNGVRVGYTRSF